MITSSTTISPSGGGSDLGVMLSLLGHNWLLAIMAVILTWLFVTRVVETTESASKYLGPLGRKIAEAYQKRQKRYREDVAAQAKLMAVELVPKVLPADYQDVKDQLTNIIGRLDDLEVENSALKSYVIYEEAWHFKHDTILASRGIAAIAEIPVRVPWADFLERWKRGWRPAVLEGM